MKSLTISVVIPCYKSEKSIENVINRVKRTIIEDGRYNYEIICVNDYSPDRTLNILKRLAKCDKHIKVISLSRNFGQHGALMAGFHYVTGDYVLCLDDDGETPPEMMFRLIDKMLDEEYDLVSAKYVDDRRGGIRSLGTIISAASIQFIFGLPKNIVLNSFYCFRAYIVDQIIKFNNPYPFVHGLILRVTKNIANVEIDRERRISGYSGYSIKRLISLFFNNIISSSEKPLRISSIIGILSSLGGLSLAFVIIIRKINNPSILVGYSSIMAAMLIMFGLLMIIIGILGEYMGRIFVSINNSPQYVVRETFNVTE